MFATVVLVVTLALARGAVAQASSYAFVTIDAPGATSTLAAGISDSREIVGQFGDARGFHGFLISKNRTLTTIDVPGASGTVARGVNSPGKIVGGYQNAAGFHGFLLSRNGTFTTIDVSGVSSTSESINSPHLIVGSSFAAAATIAPIGVLIGDDHCDGFLASKRTVTTVDVPAALCTIPSGINSRGQIAGLYLSTGFHGFLDSKGTLTTMDVPGSSLTFGRKINNLEQMVGTFRDSRGQHGFLFSHGMFRTIDVPGSTNTTAWGINDRGEIVGQFQDATGFHGFLAIPDHDDGMALPHFRTSQSGVFATPEREPFPTF